MVDELAIDGDEEDIPLQAAISASLQTCRESEQERYILLYYYVTLFSTLQSVAKYGSTLV